MSGSSRHGFSFQTARWWRSTSRELRTTNNRSRSSRFSRHALLRPFPSPNPTSPDFARPQRRDLWRGRHDVTFAARTRSALARRGNV